MVLIILCIFICIVLMNHDCLDHMTLLRNSSSQNFPSNYRASNSINLRLFFNWRNKDFREPRHTPTETTAVPRLSKIEKIKSLEKSGFIFLVVEFTIEEKTISTNKTFTKSTLKN